MLLHQLARDDHDIRRRHAAKLLVRSRIGVQSEQLAVRRGLLQPIQQRLPDARRLDVAFRKRRCHFGGTQVEIIHILLGHVLRGEQTAQRDLGRRVGGDLLAAQVLDRSDARPRPAALDAGRVIDVVEVVEVGIAARHRGNDGTAAEVAERRRTGIDRGQSIARVEDHLILDVEALLLEEALVDRDHDRHLAKPGNGSREAERLGLYAARCECHRRGACACSDRAAQDYPPSGWLLQRCAGRSAARACEPPCSGHSHGPSTSTPMPRSMSRWSSALSCG